MSKSITRTALLAALTYSISSYSNANDIAQHLSTIIIPEPIKRIAPKYPIKAAREGREGWARLSFVIDENGDVSNVLVIESSGSKDLTQSAVKAAKLWKYKPAMENGKAIQQCVNSIQMDFRMGDAEAATTGVSRKFISKYKKARQALVEKNYDEVEKQLALLYKNRYLHLSESNYLHILSADYAKEKADKPEQLSHLSLVAMSLGSLSSASHQLSVLYQTFNLQIELNKFQSAFATYEKLIALPEAKPYLNQLSAVMAKVENVISGDKNLIITADIKKDYWWSDLVRNEFTLTDVEGSLHTLDIRCANKRHVFTIEEDSSWKIPKSWENCSIYVYGETNTSFKLVEHPFSI